MYPFKIVKHYAVNAMHSISRLVSRPLLPSITLAQTTALPIIQQHNNLTGTAVKRHIDADEMDLDDVPTKKQRIETPKPLSAMRRKMLKPKQNYWMREKLLRN